MKEIINDKPYLVGLGFIFVSFLVYLAGMNVEGDATLGLFFVNYIFTAIAWVYLAISVIFFRKTFRFFRIFPVLVLSLISAYSLNRFMNLFDTSPLWFFLVLVLVSLACLSLAGFRGMNRYFQWLVLTLVGVGIVVFFYLGIYLIPAYPVSAFLFWVLGISLHSFVPLLFLIFIFIWIFRYTRKGEMAVKGLYAGSGLVLILAIIFTFRWASVVNGINDTYQESFAEDDVTLPAWVRVSQRIPRNNITNKALKVGLTYVLPDFNTLNLSNFRFSTGFTEQQLHDPFIVVAALVAGQPRLNDEEKIKILESIYDSRHQATERLWSDEGIKTTYVNSSIQIWPQFRMAYTEQIIMLRNTRIGWRDTGEAVYTFHLPEGSVVTSLSLWINGEEEKGILTTKGKADSAYRTIVGVEARDPSLVHWQEGSTVSVRVFPVTSKEERVFKIGITSPLRKKETKLVYEPVYFEGTDCSKARETIHVRFMDEPLQLKYPPFMGKNHTGLESKRKSRYKSNWTISMDDPGLSVEPFCFDAHCYHIQELQSKEVQVDIKEVYLDVNRSWSKKEFDAVWNASDGRKVKVFNGQEMVTVNSGNKDEVYRDLSKLQFSLFPVHLINKTDQSLLISKSTSASPNLSDLKDSRFFRKMKSALHPEQSVYFLDIGETLSPYLKTLREYRLLNYRKGNIEDVYKTMKQSVFLQASLENDHQVAVHDAGINIIKQSGSLTGNAPDHLMRLFAYNHIMFRYAGSWNSVSTLTEEMVEEARQAYVVSPVSSLVVLESQKDYERFGITDADNSLKNASKKSKGAIPEPHEWALLLIVIAVTCYLYIRKKNPDFLIRKI
ncbi:MAG: XrtN system VIT domain-containing protein [Bacteroidales bacterium]|jgi:XrtN system VIT domain protein|nr:XrtN system VIT domain-containing protein [Bacteroidales bacterium]